MRPIITLTTDFGLASSYVAQMKGIILGMVPDAVLVDATHAIGPQRVAAASRLLPKFVPLFPAGSIHIAVVDPGVGTERPIVAGQLDQRWVVAPDNGILSGLWRQASQRRLVHLDQPRFWRASPSRTFHGRDIMAPVAAHLALGVPLDELGSPIEQPELLDDPPVVVRADAVEGEVIEIDGFGNLLTNIQREHLDRLLGSLAIAAGNASSLVVQCAAYDVPLVGAYGEVAAGTLVALIGSSEQLELAVSGGSAADQLRVGLGERVVVRRAAL